MSRRPQVVWFQLRRNILNRAWPQMFHVLRMHAGYRCRHSGVCCTEDWAIPVEAPIYRRLAQALESSALRPEHAGATYFEPAHGLPSHEPVVTGRVGRDCAFFEPGRGRLCAIHEQLGHDHLPSACQHFPRVVTIDPRGVFVSLSHVCPTAGRLLREPERRALRPGSRRPRHHAWTRLDRPRRARRPATAGRP